MIKITIANNAGTKANIFSETTTIRQAFDWAGVDYSRGMILLNGSRIQPGDIDRTFAELGVRDNSFLSCIAKTDNA